MADPTGVIDPLIEAQNLAPAELASYARRFARADVSNFQVGACVVAESGSGIAHFIGANIEPSGLHLSRTVHAEQAALTRAALYGYSLIHGIYVTAMPCGHCRQFFMEFGTKNNAYVEVEGERYSLDSLLPEAFGPLQLLENPRNCELPIYRWEQLSESEIHRLATKTAQMGYTPYTNSLESTTIVDTNGDVASFPALESAAYNPSLTSTQVALIALSHEEVARKIKSLTVTSNNFYLVQRQELSTLFHSFLAPDAIIEILSI